jgi:uncharacterized repeat protein (TIGR01451 family)
MDRFIIFTLALTFAITGAANPAVVEIKRVSVSSTGIQANAASSSPSMSANGDVVAFVSSATNLVEGDTNDADDIFIHDYTSGLTQRISISSDGEQANNRSNSPSISADGRYIAFFSDASNLVADDTNELGDMFVHDRQTRTTIRVSLLPDGTELPKIDSGSTYVEFWLPGLITGDGMSVLLRKSTVFYFYPYGSASSILIHKIFPAHSEQTSIRGLESMWSLSPEDYPLHEKLGASFDGRYIVSAPDENVYLYDHFTGSENVISFSFDGKESSKCGVSYYSHPNTMYYKLRGASGALLSPDASTAAFNSYATNHVIDDSNGYRDIFVRKLSDGSMKRVNVAANNMQAVNGDSTADSLSFDGRFISFSSDATNLAPTDNNGATDIFVHDQETNNTWSISVAMDGTQGNGSSTSSQISYDGNKISFQSLASNFVDNDTNQVMDIFLAGVKDAPDNPYPHGDLKIFGKASIKTVVGIPSKFTINVRNTGNVKIQNAVLTQYLSADVEVTSLPKFCKLVPTPSSFNLETPYPGFSDTELCHIPKSIVNCSIGTIKRKQIKKIKFKIIYNQPGFIIMTDQVHGKLNDINQKNNFFVTKIQVNR